MIKDVRSFKVDNSLAPNSKVRLYLNHVGNFDFQTILPYLKRFTFANEVIIDDESKKDFSSIYYIGELYIEEDLDKELLRKKFDEKISAIKNELLRGDKMLNNPAFIAKAPEKKINEEKAKREKYLKELAEYQKKRDILN